ncbi:hypothetical protein N431DRAFT_471742 [Stipitochalara longipes BDJ]|nr:hypothetical protein N431DRAFT_471742 [Stipitochalara longipes BDJ]
MAPENEKQETNAFALDTAGHGETPVCNIYAPQHICTNFQPIWKAFPLGETHLGARERRARSLNRLSSWNCFDPALKQCDFEDNTWLPERRRNQEPAGEPARGRERERSNSTSSRVDASRHPSSQSRTLSVVYVSSEIRRDRSLSVYEGNESHNFITGDVGFSSLLKSYLKLTSDDLDRDPATVKNLLDRLLYTSKIPWTLYFNSSDANNVDVRYHQEPDDGHSPIKKQRDLTEEEEREVKRRAKGRWICHVCKEDYGKIIVNHESNPCKRVAECHHDHRGCKICPSRGNHMYEELLEYFRDEIRKDIREGRHRR